MPHALLFPSPPPDRAEPDRPADPAPAVRDSSKCPTCGRSPAVVFPNLRAGKAKDAAPLVCLACCPRVAGDGGGRAPGAAPAG